MQPISEASEAYLSELGSMRYFYIHTFGCQMNEYDSERIRESLVKINFQPVTQADQADVLIVNTCTVRELAAHKAFSLLGMWAKFKQERPHIIIGMVGCLAQHLGAAALKKNPEIDFLAGPRSLNRLGEMVQQIQNTRHTKIDLGMHDFGAGLAEATGSLIAKVPIIEGCNQCCTYCAVPGVRGREKSRTVPEIVSEAEIQIAGGAKEILLLGQNVNRYGLDLPPRNSFAECLKTVAQIPGLKRLRFLTGHPSGFTSKVISIMATEPAICQAVHLPLQSGSNRILKAMNRGYTREAFLDLVGEMRAAMPSIAITTDIIAGFPGETERDFEDTLEMAERVAFDAAYCFKYSPRSGTEAARFSGQLPQPIKEERLAKLLQITENITANKNRACIGTHETVLFESRDLKHPGKIFGRTRTNKWVYVEADAKHIGEELPVFINAAGNFSLIGELAHEK